MVAHSFEELHFVAYVLSALGWPVTAASIVAAIEAGDRHVMADAVFDLPTGKLMIEWDGGHYHTAEQIQNDVCKTRKLLAAYPTATVVRVRVKADPIPDLDDEPRVKVIVVDRSTPGPVLAAVGAALGYAWTSNARPPCRAAAEDARVMISDQHRVALEETVKIVGDIKAAKKLMRVNRSHTQEFRKGLVWLMTVWLMTAAQLVSFTSDGVAAHLGDPEFREGLMWLRTAWYMTSAQVVTFVRDGVAARLRDPAFREALEWLRTAWDMTSAQLTSFMCDSVAARLCDPAFREALEWLRTDWHMTSAQLTSFMCNGVAARLRDPAFREALEWLRTNWHMTSAQLVTFMCDGVAVRLCNPAFREALEWLRTDWHMTSAQLVTFMCGGVSVRLCDPAFREALNNLKEIIGLDATVQVMNGLASRLDDNFVKIVNTVVLRLREHGMSKSIALLKPPFVGHLDRVANLPADQFESTVKNLLSGDYKSRKRKADQL
jgi:hypothetical protein